MTARTKQEKANLRLVERIYAEVLGPIDSRAVDALFDPAVAVPLGAAYVHELLDRYGNQLELSLAAYNAGPLSVARWMPARPVDADVWIENIPYTETRGYVQHVLEHIVAFAVMREAGMRPADVLAAAQRAG